MSARTPAVDRGAFTRWCMEYTDGRGWPTGPTRGGRPGSATAQPAQVTALTYPLPAAAGAPGWHEDDDSTELAAAFRSS